MLIQDTEFAEWLAAEKEKLSHPDMICSWFIENQERIMDAANKAREYESMDTRGWSGYKPGDRYTALTLVYYNRHMPEAYIYNVPNSHRCPDTGVRNFARDDGKPMGYPGWRVSISGQMSRQKKNMCDYPYSNGLNLVGLKTGSGGGGNDRWMYEVSIFLDDWPGFKPLAARLEQDALFKKLKGR